MKVLLCLLLATVACASARKSYDGYQVYKVIPRNDKELRGIYQLKDEKYLDFWTEPRRSGHPVYIMATPGMTSHLKSLFDELGVDYTVHRENVQDHIDGELHRLSGRAELFPNLDDFNDFDTLMTFLDNLLAQCSGVTGLNCNLRTAGTTLEGRPIKVFEVNNGGSEKKGVWVDSGIHAREWLTHATLMNVMNHMINDYATDTEVQDMLNKHDWYFLPVLNPDGYVYSWTGDRYWRKNMYDGEAAETECYGVDLNRNYDWHHCVDGSSDLVCLDTFCGPSPASEEETQVVVAEATRLGPNLQAWVTLHSFSYLWLLPYGNSIDLFDCEKPTNFDAMMTVGTNIVNKILEISGDQWEVGNVCDVLYAASGSTMDHVRGTANVPYVYTPELRGDDFVIGPEHINASYREIWAALVEMVNTMV